MNREPAAKTAGFVPAGAVLADGGLRRDVDCAGLVA
jgi:hypothetical protein